MYLVYFLGSFVLLSHCGQCNLTWDKVYNLLSVRLDEIVIDMKSKESSMTKQVQDFMSTVTGQLASMEKRLSEVADCGDKLATQATEVTAAEVGRRTHLLRRGLEQEKAATMTRFESLRKNQEQILSRTADMETRFNETRVKISNLEHEVIDTVYNTSIIFGMVKALEITQEAMKGTEEKTRALVAIIEKEVKFTQNNFHTLQSKVQNLGGMQLDLQSKTRTIEAKVDETRADISRLTEDKTRALVAVIEKEVKSTQRNFHTLQSRVQTLVGTQDYLQSKTSNIEAQVNTTRADISRLQRFHFKKDCSELLSSGYAKLSGVYTIISPLSHTKVQVYCDMETEGGGWTVFQKRFNGSEDFYRNFSDYEAGFGSVYAEYWLGLKYIHEITSHGSYQLRVDIVLSNGNKAYEVYEGFSLQPGTNYTLNVGSGVRPNGLRYDFALHRIATWASPVGNAFTTYDHDVDRSSGNCAATYKGGWWYNKCGSTINLNGLYQPGPYVTGAMTYDDSYGIAASTMMFKSVP